MKSCFREAPDQRPDFKYIKELIQSSADSLLQTIASVNEASKINTIEVSYATVIPLETMRSNEMKERYLKVQNSNQRQDYARLKTPNENKHEGRLGNVQETKETQLGNKHRRYTLLKTTSQNQVQNNQGDDTQNECMELRYATVEHPITIVPVDIEDEGASNPTKILNLDQEISSSQQSYSTIVHNGSPDST